MWFVVVRLVTVVIRGGVTRSCTVLSAKRTRRSHNGVGSARLQAMS